MQEWSPVVSAVAPVYLQTTRITHAVLTALQLLVLQTEKKRLYQKAQDDFVTCRWNDHEFSFSS